jgi:succinyl-diaminopimelate desuccinylase
VLNATWTTAGFGDLRPGPCRPTSAEIDGGWLHGRGSADSKAAVAIFSHLLLEMLGRTDFAGRIGVLFDCDEHSGRFGGAHAFFDRPHEGRKPPRPDGVLIGYPGIDRSSTAAAASCAAC